MLESEYLNGKQFSTWMWSLLARFLPIWTDHPNLRIIRRGVFTQQVNLTNPSNPWSRLAYIRRRKFSNGSFYSL
jgi:hypothetical protein